MAMQVFLWGSLAFPLALLLWLHRVYRSILSLFSRDQSLAALWNDLHEAETFEEWEAAGLVLDHRYKIDSWRKDDKSTLYAWELIGDRLAAIALAQQAGHVQALVHLLQSGLVRNLGNITVPALYNESFAGTKYLIESYILQVCELIRSLAGPTARTAGGGDSPAVLSPASPSSPSPPRLASPPSSPSSPSSSPTSSPHSSSSSRPAALPWSNIHTLLTASQKKLVFSNLRQSFGRTTLVFQGGSIFGVCHLGVARALFLRGLLPRILTGTGMGALMAALLGTHTDAELPAVLDGRAINLSAFGEDALDEQAPGRLRGRRRQKTEHGQHGQPGQHGRLARLRRRLARFWNEGYLLDVTVLEQCVRDNGGNMTFDEAFRRTGRILNITVATADGNDVPTVLNYVTAPNVLIWTAAVASNASDTTTAAAWYGHRQTTILCRDAHGHVVPWMLGGGERGGKEARRTRNTRTTKTKTRITRIPPRRRLSQLFGVNHFVVSQARPYLVPFLEPSMHSPAMRGLAMGTLARASAIGRQQVSHFVRHRLAQAARLGWLPLAVRQLLVDEGVDYAGSSSGGGGGGHGSSGDTLVLVPHVRLRDYVRLLDAPTPETLRYWIGQGERAVWPAVAALKIRCSIELALQQACDDVGVGGKMG